MSEYNELMKRDANGDHSVKDKLEELLLVIEKGRRQVITDKAELEDRKEMIKEMKMGRLRNGQK